MKNNIKLRNIKSMLKKEFAQLFRDKKMRAVMIGPPIIMMVVFGYAVNTDVNDVRMAVVDHDRTAESRAFVEEFTGSTYFSLYACGYSSKKLVPLLDRGEIDCLVQVAQGFSEDIRSGRTAMVQIVLDGSDSNRASVVQSYLNSVTAAYSMKQFQQRVQTQVRTRQKSGMRMPAGVDLEQRVFFNPELKSRNYYLPGIIGLLISLITIMLTSMSIVKEREAGTIEQINVSPLHPLEYIAGKMIPFAVVSFIIIFAVTTLTITWFDVPFNGSFVFVLFTGLLYILSTLAVGLYISTISMTQQQAMLSSFLFFVPAILLCGFIFPIYAMPESVQLVTYLNPLTYYMNIVRGVYLRGVGALVLWKDMTAMVALGVVLLFMSVKRFNKRME